MYIAGDLAVGTMKTSNQRSPGGGFIESCDKHFKMKNEKKEEKRGRQMGSLDLHRSGDFKNMMKDNLEEFRGIIHEVLMAAICRL